jgi:hypothetical protein
MYGIGWRERWDRRDEGEVRARRLSLRVHVLEAAPLARRPERAFDLEIPGDVRLVEGSRK